jgi:probable selenium-dependent hydroxylase accessory protein YqeC
MNLAGALGLGERELVAFVGAGGKQTAMSALAEAAGGRRVGYTTTTHMRPPEFPLVIARQQELRDRLADSPDAVAFAAERVESPSRATSKVRGYDPAVADALFEAGTFDWLLVKADGARRREFKAPAEHEPAIPPGATTVVVVASTAVLGDPLDESLVHRPDRVAALAGIDPGDALTPAAVAAVLADDEGGLRNVPPDSEVLVVLNKADTPDRRAGARAVVRSVLDRTDRVSHGVVTSFRSGTCETVSGEP